MEIHTGTNHPAGELEEILAHCWFLLESGAKRSSVPFHTPVIGISAAINCKLRAVVLQRVVAAKRLLICHTDRRSAKVAERNKSKRLGWLFYDRERKIQIRAEGAANLHFDDALADERWTRTSAMSRRCYCGEEAPGTIKSSQTSGLPRRYEKRSPTLEESEWGRRNFAVISCKLDLLDCLNLAAVGHSRAQFNWLDEKLEANWVVP